MNNPIDILRKIATDGLSCMGLYYSFYDAKVTDNDDPDKLMRIKFNCPELNINSRVWAHPIGINAGLVSPPPVGANIQIKFKYGIPSNPYWKYGRPTTGRRITEADTNYPNVHLFKSPNGIIVKIDDSEDTVTITNAAGKSIVVKPSGRSLGDSNPIVLGNENQQALEQIRDLLADFSTNLLQFATTQATASSANPTTAGLAPAFTDLALSISTEITPDILQLSTQIPLTNSLENTTD